MANEKNIRVDLDADLIASNFSVETPLLTHFLNEKETFEIKEGYGGANVLVINGIADEWIISWDNKEFTMSISGRDNLKLALETYFKKSYFLYQPLIIPKTEYDELIPYSVGSTMASTVAQEVCSEAGLSLVWTCPDYAVVNSVVPTQGYKGYAADILRQLVEPFQTTKMYRVDINIEGTVVYIKRRSYPIVPDETLSIEDTRIEKLTLKKINTNDNFKHIRKIFYSRQEAHSFIILNRRTPDVVETFDANGNILTRETSVSEFKLEVLVNMEKQKYALLDPANPASSSLVLVENTTTVYDYGGIISTNYIKERGRVETSTFYSVNSDKTGTNKTSEVTNTVRLTYNSDDAIIMEDSIKTIQNYSNGAANGDPSTEQQVVTHKLTSKDLIETIVAKSINGEHVGRTSHTQAGQLPGPKRVGQNSNTSSSTNDTVLWYDSITIGLKGEDIEISNNLLSREQLLTEARYVQSEYSSRQYILDLESIPCPWLKKNNTLRITGSVTDANGDTFDLGQLIWRIERMTNTHEPDAYTGRMRLEAWL